MPRWGAILSLFRHVLLAHLDKSIFRRVSAALSQAFVACSRTHCKRMAMTLVLRRRRCRQGAPRRQWRRALSREPSVPTQGVRCGSRLLGAASSGSSPRTDGEPRNSAVLCFCPSWRARAAQRQQYRTRYETKSHNMWGVESVAVSLFPTVVWCGMELRHVASLNPAYDVGGKTHLRPVETLCGRLIKEHKKPASTGGSPLKIILYLLVGFSR